ncbi:MAG: hypothetical protein Q9165_007157 [Trypethelium subeluteriae]
MIKSVSGYPRVEHERDILRLFDKSPLLRKQVDEIEEPAEPTTIVLEYLDTDLDQCSNEKTLNRYELNGLYLNITDGIGTEWRLNERKVISLIYGDGIHLMTPSISCDHDDYEFEVLNQQYMFFGPIPDKYDDQVEEREDLKKLLLHLFEVTPANETGLFKRITKKEISEEDSVFLQRIMKWDWRDRPTAMQLLEDGWFKDMSDKQ